MKRTSEGGRTQAAEARVSALVGWGEGGGTDRYGSGRSKPRATATRPGARSFWVLARVGNGGERCGGGRRTRTRMRRGRGCAGERRGRAEEAERGGRNGAEGGEVRHGVFAPVGRFCWVGLGVRVGGRSTAQKTKGGSEQKDENSKNSTEKADFVVFFCEDVSVVSCFRKRMQIRSISASRRPLSPKRKVGWDDPENQARGSELRTNDFDLDRIRRK